MASKDFYEFFLEIYLIFKQFFFFLIPVAFNFGNTTVPGSFNFPQQSAGGTSYQSLPVTTGAVQPGSQPQQPQVQVKPTTISKYM